MTVRLPRSPNGIIAKTGNIARPGDSLQRSVPRVIRAYFFRLQTIGRPPHFEPASSRNRPGYLERDTTGIPNPMQTVDANTAIPPNRVGNSGQGIGTRPLAILRRFVRNTRLPGAADSVRCH